MNRDIVRACAQFAAYTVLIFAPVLGIHALAYAIVPEPTQPLPARSASASPLPLVECATEDSTGCYWDASEQGNGLGQDLWN
jgi:hypothetical protein